MARNGGSAYFRRTSLIWIVVVTLTMGYYTWTVFWPDQVPYDKLGPLGSLSRHLVDHHYKLMYYGWWLAWLIHLAEALYCLKVCSDKGVHSFMARSLWFVQTFLFGITSLSLLLKYQPEALRKRH